MNIHYKLKKLIQNNKNHPNILLYSYNIKYCKFFIINILDNLYNIKNITNIIKE